MVTLSQIRSHLARLLHLKESPHRTALAFAVGVFIAFSPTYGLHTLSVLFCAWAFRLNAVALLAGSLITNPWTLVPVLGATLWTGVQLTGLPEGMEGDTDTAVSGPLLIGTGAGYLRSVGGPMRFIAELNVIAGIPVAKLGEIDPGFALQIDANLGLIVAF